MTIKAGLRKAEKTLGLGAFGPRFSPEDCPDPQFGAFVFGDEPQPPAHEVKVCRNCGGQHIQRVVEVLVERDPASGEMVEVGRVADTWKRGRADYTASPSSSPSPKLSEIAVAVPPVAAAEPAAELPAAPPAADAPDLEAELLRLLK